MITSTQPEHTKNEPSPAAGKGATPVKKAHVAKRRADVAPPKATPARKATRTKKAATARRGSKTAKILGLLKRPGGALLKELMKATGWQPHSIRGFLSGTLRKKMGIPFESFRSTDGERAYQVRSK